jgi:hypothetical protein
MSEEQVMDSVGTQGCAADVRKQNLPIAPGLVAKPGFQHGHCGFGKRHTSLLSTLPHHTNMSARTYSEIIAGQAAHF